MRDYIRKSSGIPPSVHARAKALLMDYDRMCGMRADLLYGSAPPSNGMPRGSGTGNPTESRAMKLAAVDDQISAIDQTAMLLRGAYSGKTCEDFDPVKAYWNYNYFNYQHVRTAQKPHGPSTRTWHRYKDTFTRILAEKLKFF